jgi:hypothetical protein
MIKKIAGIRTRSDCEQQSGLMLEPLEPDWNYCSNTCKMEICWMSWKSTEKSKKKVCSVNYNF